MCENIINVAMLSFALVTELESKQMPTKTKLKSFTISDFGTSFSQINVD